MTVALVILTILGFLCLDSLYRYALPKVKMCWNWFHRPAPDAIWNGASGWTFADGGNPVKNEGDEKIAKN